MNEYERVACLFDEAFNAAIELALKKSHTYKEAQQEMYQIQLHILNPNNVPEFMIGLEKKAPTASGRKSFKSRN